MEILAGLRIYPDSVIEVGGTTYMLGRGEDGKKLCIAGDAAGFDGEVVEGVTVCPLTAHNASSLCKKLPWLRPQPLGTKTSAGCGDRLGLATPGHIRALRQVGGGLAPILAQQSMRENVRTGRSPQQVMDDAMWGVFQENWRLPWGADADHLKTLEDIDLCLQAGYTFFTIDPGDHVDNQAHTAPLDILEEKFQALPWDQLEDSPAAMRSRYLDHLFTVEDFTLEFDETRLARAASKYGRAIAHTVRSYRHLASRSPDFDFEMSVDETETPTSVEEHFFIAGELQRLNVRWVSLAPRYPGRFEKGVDYIGDLAAFNCELAKHAAIARALGPYKLSIHSGSDKFSIYPAIARQTRGLVHLKTAGTSFLEALRAIAGVEPDFFREILGLAITRYPQDKATYHVSANPDLVPPPDSVTDGALAALLDQFDTRQVLHVTFGSILDRFGGRLKSTLAANEEAHYAALEAHFIKHLKPFIQ